MRPARQPEKSARATPKSKAADPRANPPTGRRGKNVRPLQAKPEIGKNYEFGFRTPPEKNPWQDEGDPEGNG